MTSGHCDTFSSESCGQPRASRATDELTIREWRRQGHGDGTDVLDDIGVDEDLNAIVLPYVAIAFGMFGDQVSSRELIALDAEI